jgi:hypothetical protein
VLLLVLAAVAMLTVPLAGGSLARLADLRFRHVWLPALAIAVQILLISMIPDGDGEWREAVHLGRTCWPSPSWS